MDNDLSSTSRAKLIQLLRRAKLTVNELAHSLGLTDNAVRASLARLERDGLVQQAGSRPSFRKPEAVYDVTPEADRLFSRAYVPVLVTLLGVLESNLEGKALDRQLREVGRRLAAPHLPSMAGLPPRQRAEKTLKILEELGGLAELEERDGRLSIRGFGCPFSQAVCEHPKLCVVAEAMVGELLGRPVAEQCDRGERPKCCFAID